MKVILFIVMVAYSLSSYADDKENKKCNNSNSHVGCGIIDGGGSDGGHIGIDFSKKPESAEQSKEVKVDAKDVKSSKDALKMNSQGAVSQ